jgi:polysaccharide export outer membrane protein
MRIKPVMFSLCIAAMLTACSPGADLPLLPQDQGRGYTLGPGDQLRIITYGEDQLTGDFTVNDGGNIEVPLLGTVKAKGLSVAQLQVEVANDLKSRQLIKAPSVAIEVSQYRPVFVLGEVVKPGSYPYQPEMTILTAIALAGGFTYRAVKDTQSVTRAAGGHASEFRATPQSLLQPGDVVNVFERHF